MADIEITQSDADSLIAMEKFFVDENDWMFPPAGGRIGVRVPKVQLNVKSLRCSRLRAA